MKFIAVILGFTLVLCLDDRVVQAQSLPSTGAPDEATPNSSQSSPSPTVTPSDAPSTEQSKPLRNYIGVGGNIGVSGGSKGISQGGVTIFMKNDLSDSLSIRGINVFGGNRIDSTTALTVNFPVKTSSGQVQLVPFIGGGILLRSKSNWRCIIEG